MNGEKKFRLLVTREGVSYVLPFIVVTCCFALWGFANDITNPMVKAFSKIFRMSVTDGTLVQVAFYGGYFCMALPAALFIRRHSFRSGIVMGLALYALGVLLFIPARTMGSFAPFLVAYFILTCGLSFLETTANPYILLMGDPETATRRLNFAQSFNPVGSLTGMVVAMNFIQARLSPLDTAQRALLDDAQFEALKQSDLGVLVHPYAMLGVVIVVLLVIMLLVPVPVVRNTSREKRSPLWPAVKRLWANKSYRNGVVAQFFYVGAQITCWTFIIQYGTRVFMAEGMGEQAAEVLSQRYNIVAMVLFCVMRFVGVYLMKYVKPGRLMAILAAIAILLLVGVIVVGGRTGMCCLVAVSACMSVMFPTIYGLALGGIKEDTEVGSAGLIMAILGGSLLPAFQAMLIDSNVKVMPAVNLSFVVPLICFIVVLWYGMLHAKPFNQQE
ncbi:MAG: L-fucose:H+ symporter permease [Muribaculaceae bacterium]|nr:L-fucose:H+ symporter permease [Muribaculaceae bacterium]